MIESETIFIEGRSSNVSRMTFEKTEEGPKGRLTVEFSSGDIYDFEGVDEAEWEMLQAVWREGGSMGKAFHGIIRGKYEGQKRLPEDE